MAFIRVDCHVLRISYMLCKRLVSLLYDMIRRDQSQLWFETFPSVLQI